MIRPVLAIYLRGDQGNRRFLLAAAAALRRSGQLAQAREMFRRGVDVGNWRALLLLVVEYVDLDLVIRG